MTSPWDDLARPPLREAALRQALTSGPAASWRHLDVVALTGSTNADLAERARAGEAEGAVLVADHQNAGRGRRGRVWDSPPRAGIAVSVLLRPGVPTERWSWLNLMAGVAVTDALRRICGVDAQLKWPNDVLVPVDGEDRKVCGLLAEVIHDAGSSAVVLGIGLNVTQDAAELPVPTATSLKLAGSATTDRDTVLRAVLRALADRYRRFLENDGDPRAGLGADYRERCVTIGLPVDVHLPDGSIRRGEADGVDDDGRLLVTTTEGGARTTQALSAGDVVHIRRTETA